MRTNPRTILLVTLGAAAVVLSRAMFTFFNDPEGPNLLVVSVMAVVIFLPALAVFFYAGASASESKKFWSAIPLEVLLTAVLTYVLK